MTNETKVNKDFSWVAVHKQLNEILFILGGWEALKDVKQNNTGDKNEK